MGPKPLIETAGYDPEIVNDYLIRAVWLREHKGYERVLFVAGIGVGMVLAGSILFWGGAMGYIPPKGSVSFCWVVSVS